MAHIHWLLNCVINLKSMLTMQSTASFSGQETQQSARLWWPDLSLRSLLLSQLVFNSHEEYTWWYTSVILLCKSVPIKHTIINYLIHFICCSYTLLTVTLITANDALVAAAILNLAYLYFICIIYFFIFGLPVLTALCPLNNPMGMQNSNNNNVQY